MNNNKEENPTALNLSEPKKKLSKQAAMGRNLLDKVFERDTDKGGLVTEITGISGSGKTSLLLGFATRIIKNNPGELVYWREAIGSPCQFNKIDDSIGYQLLVEKRYHLRALEITNNLRHAPLEIRPFRGVKELIKISKPGMLNVVYFKDLYKWVDLILALRLLPGWKTLLWDEYEDIVPQRCKGIAWQKNDDLSNNIKQLRKSGINLIMNTQSNMDADFRVRSKIMSWIYCYGSRVDSLSPVTDSAVHGLRVGEAWIDHGHSLFGKFSFQPFKPKEHIYTIIEGK
jgi:hypothetical protein